MDCTGLNYPTAMECKALKTCYKTNPSVLLFVCSGVHLPPAVQESDTIPGALSLPPQSSGGAHFQKEFYLLPNQTQSPAPLSSLQVN